ncbi:MULTISPECIES: Lsr2 family protein [Rhodococcus]|uniref:Lsr2 family protein n=2 Tax=Rhodococcus erythropolis group TaxID=2840174 RepID=A0AAW6LQE8_RHOSG|nr:MULTISPECIES: Lsr2 family protein [Rhodococcus]MDE8647482.1 Lsr2 family protein [Rhodococcus qingshengii]
MATVTTTAVVDDFDRSPNATTIQFSVGKSFYEIDLNAEHTDELYEALRPYINKARRMKAPKADKRTEHNKIRDWAKKEGLEVSDRGRLSAELIQQYHAAHS